MLKLIQTDGEKFYAAASTPSYACVDDGGTRADGRDAAASRRRAGRKHQGWRRRQAEKVLVAVGRWVACAARQNAGAQSVRRS